MYKSTILSTAVLSQLALSTFGISITQNEDLTSSVPELIGEPEPLLEVSEPQLVGGDAATFTPTTTAQPVVDVPTHGLIEHQIEQATEHLVKELEAEAAESDSDSSDGDCCGCAAACDPCGEHTDNIPDSMYLDPTIKQESDLMMAALEPEVIDLVLDLDLTADDAANMEAEILIPALQKALADLVALRPELAGLMPEVPSNLEDAINEVRGQMQYESDVDVHGTTTHSVVTGNGWIDDSDAFEQFGELQKINPVVVFLTNEGCGEACEKFDTQWLNLRKNNPGLVAVQIDTDVMVEEAAGIYRESGIEETVPFFKLYYANEVHYESNGEDWADLRKAARSTLAASKLQHGRVSSETSSLTESHAITDELASSIAASFGYDMDAEERSQNADQFVDEETE